MVLGIDPRNDFAFKCVFGSERHTAILVDVLNAVLRPPSGRRVVSVEILNPMTEPVVLDEKLAILDLRARDQTGRQFNVEMQMVAHPSFAERFLYYWAKVYSSQLVAGDRYEALQPVISICFLDAILFPDDDRYHLRFQLFDEVRKVRFTDQLELHLFQLPNFVKTAEELSRPLDCWLYFLNNGSSLDPDNLPEALRRPEVEEAVEVVRMLTQDEIRRAMYEDREKARRDAASWQSAIDRWKQETDQLRQELATTRERERRIGEIRAYECVLKKNATLDDQLAAMSLDELRQRVDDLKAQVDSDDRT
jgi:predicted transposase/invertase (TIGR01784 family)